MKAMGEQVEEMAASPTPALLLSSTPSSSQPPTCNAEPPSSSSSPPPASQPPAAAPSRPAITPPPPEYSPPPPESPPSPALPSASPPAPALYPSAPSASPPTISPPPPPPPTIVKPPTFYYRSPPPPSPLHPAVPSAPPPSPAPFTSPPPPPPPRTLPPPAHPSPPAVPSPANRSSPPALPSAAPVRPNPPNPPSTSRNAKDLVVQRSSSGGSGVATGTVTTIAVFSGLLMLTFVVAAVWFVKKRKKPFGGGSRGGVLLMASPAGSTNSHASDASNSRSRTPSYPFVRNTSGSSSLPYSSSEPGLGNVKLWFTLDDLSTITNGFSAQNLLGEGGFGSVYKGCLQDGRLVAVKQLKMGAKQGEREFKAEVETISRVHHRHLVSLVGYCTSDDDRLLVYDYVPNKTLYHHLHGKGTMVMDWTTRVKVAAGAARGIAYLHEDCHPRIIHRDIKSSNILLDNNFEAKVSDFGLARSALDSNTHVTTRVMGTFGYLAPEYASSGKLTEKSDVYSFGVVLLELITGRKPVDRSQPLGDESLVEWARPSLVQALETRNFGDLPDPRLEKNYVEDEMFRMIEAAAACVRHSASMRPKMSQVARSLDGLAETDITNGVRPGQSEIFSSPPESGEIRMFQRREFGNLDCSSERTRSNWISRTDL